MFVSARPNTLFNRNSDNAHRYMECTPGLRLIHSIQIRKAPEFPQFQNSQTPLKLQTRRIPKSPDFRNPKFLESSNRARVGGLGDGTAEIDNFPVKDTDQAAAPATAALAADLLLLQRLLHLLPLLLLFLLLLQLLLLMLFLLLFLLLLLFSHVLFILHGFASASPSWKWMGSRDPRLLPPPFHGEELMSEVGTITTPIAVETGQAVPTEFVKVRSQCEFLQFGTVLRMQHPEAPEGRRRTRKTGSDSLTRTPNSMGSFCQRATLHSRVPFVWRTRGVRTSSAKHTSAAPLKTSSSPLVMARFFPRQGKLLTRGPASDEKTPKVGEKSEIFQLKKYETRCRCPAHSITENRINTLNFFTLSAGKRISSIPIPISKRYQIEIPFTITCTNFTITLPFWQSLNNHPRGSATSASCLQQSFQTMEGWECHTFRLPSECPRSPGRT
ncbi:unnamed protein product [Nesidiocoris tenuis]|uniref:Uncharacterized protein n=1 Tax=Nesidiocoris tenuis TaxID=355587 RepID=A0A6H5HL05_9HEMI|nr:unnamed protein product [Nesidiocoris tenuis]